MNKHRFPHPAAVYLVLLVLTILVSWIGGVYGMKGGSGNGIIVRSLLDTQGLRWMISHSVSALSDAPVGNAMLLLSIIGIVRGSGIPGVLSRLYRKGEIAYKERLGIAFAAFLFLIITALYLWGVFGADHVLLGITGSVTSGPLPAGALFLLFILISLPATVLGFMTDRFRSADDVLRALVSLYGRYATFFLTMLIASQFLAVLEYSRLSLVMGLAPSGFRILSFIIYWLPLCYMKIVPLQPTTY